MRHLVYPPDPSTYRIKIAGCAWRFVLDRLKFIGITIPGRIIVLHPDYAADQRLINHELAHIAQLDREGPWRFWPKIVLCYLWFGHFNSPYEREARTYESL